MRTEQLGSLTARITGGPDGQGGGDGPVVILMHGFGAPGTDLVPLANVLRAPPGTRFVFPAAPLAFDMGFGESRAWWMIDIARYQRALLTGEVGRLPKDVPEGLDSAREQVIELLDAVASRLSVTSDRIVLGGFSQGSMLAIDTALRIERPLAGLVVLSGAIVAEDDWIARMPSRRGLRVFQSHGMMDPVLPYFLAERLRHLLEDSGLSVDWVPFTGMHEIPLQVLEGLGTALERMLTPASE